MLTFKSIVMPLTVQLLLPVHKFDWRVIVVLLDLAIQLVCVHNLKPNNISAHILFNLLSAAIIKY